MVLMVKACTPASPLVDGVLTAPARWRAVEFISDLHLQASEADTFLAWERYMRTLQVDALFILGDLFEVWIGDDAAQPDSFEARCGEILRETASRLPVYFMHGNRDFLVGPDYLSSCAVVPLPDPTALSWAGQCWLLSHGDALCLSDTGYQAFRAQVRTGDWQRRFLTQSIAERRLVARTLRQQSEQRKNDHLALQMQYADVDTQLAIEWLISAGSRHLIHGHTHQPALHHLDEAHDRTVLSDWDLNACPPRGQALRLSRATDSRTGTSFVMERIDVT